MRGNFSSSVYDNYKTIGTYLDILRPLKKKIHFNLQHKYSRYRSVLSLDRCRYREHIVTRLCRSLIDLGDIRLPVLTHAPIPIATGEIFSSYIRKRRGIRPKRPIRTRQEKPIKEWKIFGHAL